jgi:hypothetical protein
LGEFVAKLAIVRYRSFERFPKSVDSGKKAIDVGIANDLTFRKSIFQKEGIP